MRRSPCRTRGAAQVPTEFPTRFAARPATGPQVRVRKHVTRQVVILEVAGRLSNVVEELDLAIQLALADGPRGVVCDLSAVFEGAGPAAVAVLATAGRHVRDWPGIPVAVACPDPRVRAALTAHPLGRHLIVTASVLSALSEVLATPATTVERLGLAPHPSAPRAARHFVIRTLLDWGLGRVISSASLVVSELVTNSTIHAGTDIALSVAWNAGALRLTVRDNNPGLPHQRHSTPDLHGRGLTIVAGLSRAFGVLPTAGGGKVVWAVFDAPRPGPSTSPRRSEPATRVLPMFTDARGVAGLPFCAGSSPHPTATPSPQRGVQTIRPPGEGPGSPQPKATSRSATGTATGAA
ncbi:MAG TPA: ATP-binding protein [Dermatophilaceae bacterium]